MFGVHYTTHSAKVRSENWRIFIPNYLPLIRKIDLRLLIFQQWIPWANSGLRDEIGEIFTLSRYYAEYSGNSLPTFRETLFVPFSTVKKTKKKPWISWFLKMGLILCPETSVRNYNYTLRNIPEERRSHRISCVSHGPLFLIHRLLIKFIFVCMICSFDRSSNWGKCHITNNLRNNCIRSRNCSHPCSNNIFVCKVPLLCYDPDGKSVVKRMKKIWNSEFTNTKILMMPTKSLFVFKVDSSVWTSKNFPLWSMNFYEIDVTPLGFVLLKFRDLKEDKLPYFTFLYIGILQMQE